MVNIRIKANEDKYQIDEIDCFEKPIGIVLESLGEGYSNLFYMCLKLTQAYNINKYYPNQIKSTIESEMDLKKRLLKNEFNIGIYSDICNDNLHDSIESKINDNSVILIPASLMELYYSKYYKKRNWPHLFLIKGYDRENKLYYTLDSTQFYKENLALYKDFVIQYDVLEKIHEAYKKEFFNELYFIDCKEKDNIIDRHTIIKKCLDLYLNDLNHQPYREIDYINYMYESLNIKEEVTYFSEKLFRTIKAKNVFYSELIDILKKSNYRKDALDNLETDKERLINSWKKVINIIFVNVRRKKKLDVNEEVSEVVALEKKIRNALVEVEKFINENKDNIINNKTGIYIENNEDNIIQVTENNEYIFNFPKGKVYTSWFEDDSPKVVIEDVRKYKNGVIISSKVKINKSTEFSNFHAGIFLRTEQDYLYFWGSHCGNVLRMDLSGIYTDLFTIEKECKEVSIRAIVNKNLCTIQSLENDKVEKSYDIKLIGDVVQVGVACKTWDDSDPVNIIFEDIKVEWEEYKDYR